jgi:hypothetical protein
MSKLFAAIALLCLATFSSSTFAASCQEKCAAGCGGKGALCFNKCSTSCAQTGKGSGKGAY